MSALKLGSLCSGYGGLEMGVAEVLDVETAWVSDIDRGACKILAHRFPDVPNLGDMTAVDWSTVEPVDVLCGGTPCQDLSHAGKRAGMTEGTRSNLWVAMREAIAQLRPRLVVWENVRGAYSAGADSGLEHDPRLLAETRRRDGEPVLRALGRVLGDLSDLGYDASWHGLRAADVGAPHGRFRVFVVAHRQGDEQREPAITGPVRHELGASVGHHSIGNLLPTPVADNSRGLPSAGTDYQSLPNTVCSLLPTPAVNDMGAAYTPDEWDAWTERMKAEHGNGNGHGKSLHIEAARLLPTPTTTQRGEDTAAREGRPGAGPNLHNEITPERWGQYARAIARWENLTRPAPAPTETGPKGNPRLSAAFSEWMMGLPAGWVTAVPGITRNEELMALGNGVVPQQAAAALREMFAWEAS